MEINAVSALGDRTRRTIVNRLRMGPKSVAQICKIDEGKPARGLKILLEAGLVKRISRGRQTFYSVDLQGLEQPRLFIEGLEEVIEKYGRKKRGE